MEEERTPGDDQPISLREARDLVRGLHEKLDLLMERLSAVAQALGTVR